MTREIKNQYEGSSIPEYILRTLREIDEQTANFEKNFDKAVRDMDNEINSYVAGKGSAYRIPVVEEKNILPVAPGINNDLEKIIVGGEEKYSPDTPENNLEEIIYISRVPEKDEVGGEKNYALAEKEIPERTIGEVEKDFHPSDKREEPQINKRKNIVERVGLYFNKTSDNLREYADRITNNARVEKYSSRVFGIVEKYVGKGKDLAGRVGFYSGRAFEKGKDFVEKYMNKVIKTAVVVGVIGSLLCVNYKCDKKPVIVESPNRLEKQIEYVGSQSDAEETFGFYVPPEKSVEIKKKPVVKVAESGAKKNLEQRARENVALTEYESAMKNAISKYTNIKYTSVGRDFSNQDFREIIAGRYESVKKSFKKGERIETADELIEEISRHFKEIEEEITSRGALPDSVQKVADKVRSEAKQKGYSEKEATTYDKVEKIKELLGEKEFTPEMMATALNTFDLVRDHLEGREQIILKDPTSRNWIDDIYNNFPEFYKIIEGTEWADPRVKRSYESIEEEKGSTIRKSGYAQIEYILGKPKPEKSRKDFEKALGNIPDFENPRLDHVETNKETLGNVEENVTDRNGERMGGREAMPVKSEFSEQNSKDLKSYLTRMSDGVVKECYGQGLKSGKGTLLDRMYLDFTISPDGEIEDVGDAPNTKCYERLREIKIPKELIPEKRKTERIEIPLTNNLP